uniref:ATP-dependent helicase C-terminal domain-containing protein n=1 Tax=Vannella robusta TaxID=1487602 RepID=A0A7S4I0P8_9EUKA|mmetsp:Transcript_18659/g.23654  ORF Transcript_18659/g.23654 Transcript_18659/m.23654 type:complete len:125 (+) Transcript_18659:108-482(+)
MSEGINFSDELGRCVVMVGLPYPNKNDPLLQEKLKYLTETKSNQENLASEYYENMCMKAVNQSIGRSIRHRNDYSTILLLDERFHSQKISSKLPQWIQDTLKEEPTFGSTLRSVRNFFRSRRET